MIALDNENINGNYSSDNWDNYIAFTRAQSLSKLLEMYYSIMRMEDADSLVDTLDYELGNAEILGIAYKCAYGMLLRHAMECILHDKLKELHGRTKDKTADELINEALKKYPDFDEETKQILYDTKNITNQLSHIKHFVKSEITFESCQDFYNKKFKSIIENHLHSSYRYTCYLWDVYEQLENFNLNNKLTKTLLLGSVMRQILECIVDIWIDNEEIDRENENIKNAGVFDKIKALETNETKYISPSTTKNLHTIRKAINNAMHVIYNNDMDISTIHSILMQQTSTLDIEIKRLDDEDDEIEMPTEDFKIVTPDDEHVIAVKNHFPWATVLKWILFFPILIPIKIGKSNMESVKKVISIFLAIGFITWPFISGLFVVLPTHIMLQTRAVITVDVNDVVDSLVGNYNHYGCFVSDEISQTQVVKDKTYIIKIKKDSVLEDGTLLALTINRDNDVVGTASIKAIHEQYLSNGDEIRFEIGEEIEGNYQIELTETTISVKNLNDTEIIRNDPREHLNLVFSHKVTEGFWTYNWNKIKLNKSEYTIGDKTIRLSLIEDKRPGAEEVNPGLKFEVFDSNKKSIAVGEYIFVNLQYDANYDDYGKMYTNSFDLTPNFDQAEMLINTGILFIDTVSTYNF